MGKIIEKEKLEKDVKTKEENPGNKKGIEELLIELRTKKGISRVELLQKLENTNLSEKDIKKWEIGLKYPDLDIIYKLSEIYRVPSIEFIKAKNNSYEKGLLGINKRIIRWFVYTLNVSFKIGVVLTILLYVFTFIFALWFFVTIAGEVKGPN